MNVGELKDRLKEVDDSVPVDGHLHMERGAAGNLTIVLASSYPAAPPAPPNDPNPLAVPDPGATADAEIAAAEGEPADEAAEPPSNPSDEPANDSTQF